MLGALLFLIGSTVTTEEPYTPPNVILILIDDLGIDQLACYDDENHYTSPYPYAYTPNIDRLAAEGVRFTQARATPICSPTRAALHSGRYGRRTGIGAIVQPHPPAGHAPYEFNVTGPAIQPLAEMLRLEGYSTGMFGKLHLQHEACPPTNGTGDDYAVSVLGFDRYAGLLRNPENQPRPPVVTGVDLRGYYYRYYYWVEADLAGSTRLLECGCPPCGSTPDQCSHQGCAPTCQNGQCYAGTYATRKQRLAVQGWTTHLAQEPFFALWCLNDVHGPKEWPPGLDAFTPPDVEGHHFGVDAPDSPPQITFNNTRTRAKLEYVDNSIGKLLQQVPWENTVVIVMGDNGTDGAMQVESGEEAYPPGHPDYQDFCGTACPPFSMDPYQSSRMKGSSYEGGVRIPLIVAGAGVVAGSPQSPRSSDALVDVVDLFELLRELALGPQYTPSSSCVQTTPPADCRDGISFACVLSNACDADGHARQYSHAAIFSPNGWPVIPTINSSTAPHEYYIRRSGGQLWKIVRKYVATTSPLSCHYEDEFYNLSIDPLETNPLSAHLPNQEYARTRADFDARFPPFFGPCP